MKCNFDQQVAERNHDVQLGDFVESEFLSEQVLLLGLPSSLSPSEVIFIYHEQLTCYWYIYMFWNLNLAVWWFPLQVEAIKKISEYVAQLRRVGKGHGRNPKSCLISTSLVILLFINFSLDKYSSFTPISFCLRIFVF